MPEKLNRAYALLEIKAVDSKKRTIKGVATTPTPDRVGDVIEPLGVEFKNPMPLLWQHKHDQPIGLVRFDKPTKKGIDFEAQLAAPTQSENLIKRVDEALESVELGLVRGVSIGFMPKEFSFMDDGGIHFQKTEVWELSLVTIPANPDAAVHDFKSMAPTINELKSIDAPLLTASGLEPATIERPKRPGVTGKSIAQKGAPKMKTIAEQIAAYEATRAAKAARMEELMNKAAEDGSTLEDAESKEYDELETDIKKVDQHLVRLRAREKEMKAAALPVETGTDLVVRAPSGVRAKILKPDLPAGTAITRYVMSLAYAKGDTMKAIQYAKQFKDSTPEVAQVLEACGGDIQSLMSMKTPVAPGTTTDSVWAAPLVNYTIMANELIELLRPATIIGRIPGLRRVPFNIQMPSTTTGTSVGWVGEGAPKKVSAMGFGTVTLRFAKAAGIVVLTDELVRFSNPAAESVVRADLVAAMAQFLDAQFVDPSVAEITNTSPASITNGVSAIPASGTTIAAFLTDARAMLNAMLVANLNISSGVWIMTQQQALALSMAQNALGQIVYPTINAQGGTLLGYPVIASENIPSTTGSPADGYPIIFAIANEIMLADDGQTVIDASNQASVQMESAPDSPPTASTTLVSLWQMNMTGVRAERWINWKKRRSTSVGYISNAKYTG